jgi:Family of unknown function (DUF6318)
MLALVLAGCSGDPEPQPTSLPPAPSPTTPSPSPSPTEPASAATAQSASDFARSYYAALTAAFESMDTRPVSAISLKSCKACANLVSAVEQRHAAGDSYRGGGFRVRTAEATGVVSGASTVTVQYDSPRLELLDAAGKVLQERAALVAAASDVKVVRRGTTWKVAEVISLSK